MSWMGLLWRRRWVVLLGALVSVAVAVPSLSSTPKGYVSTGEVFIPDIDPISDVTRGTSPVPVELQSYTRDGLRDDVRAWLGSSGDELVSISVSQQRDLSSYSISVEARSREVASEGVAIAGDVLVQESNRLVDEQIDQMRAEVTTMLQPIQELTVRRAGELRAAEAGVRDLEGTIRNLERRGASDATIDPLRERLNQMADEIILLESRLDVLAGQSKGLTDLIEGASATRIARRSASLLITGPTPAQTTRTEDLVQTVALALLVGLVVAALMIMWLDRGMLVPSARRAPEPENLGAAPDNGRAQSAQAPGAAPTPVDTEAGR